MGTQDCHTSKTLAPRLRHSSSEPCSELLGLRSSTSSICAKLRFSARRLEHRDTLEKRDTPGRQLQHPMPASQASSAPAMRVCAPVGLRLASLAVVLACALAAPVLLQPQDVESASGPTRVDSACSSRCAAVLRDSAILRRSLSRCADSVAASETRAVTLARAAARRFRASKRRADRLLRENAGLRAQLEAMPKPVAEIIPTISSQAGSAGLGARSLMSRTACDVIAWHATCGITCRAHGAAKPVLQLHYVESNVRPSMHLSEPGRKAYPAPHATTGMGCCTLMHRLRLGRSMPFPRSKFLCLRAGP